MSKFFGQFVAFKDGGTVVDKVKSYANYDEMVNDASAVSYGICEDTGTVWRKENGSWVQGFKNIVDTRACTAFEVYPTDTLIPAGSTDGIPYVFNGASWVLTRIIAKGDAIVKDDKTYTYDGNRWVRSEEYAHVDKDSFTKFGVTLTFDGTRKIWLSDYSPSKGDVIAKGDNAYIFDGTEWKDGDVNYTPVKNDIVIGGGIKYTFDGNTWSDDFVPAIGDTIVKVGAEYTFNGTAWKTGSTEYSPVKNDIVVRGGIRYTFSGSVWYYKLTYGDILIKEDDSGKSVAYAYSSNKWRTDIAYIPVAGDTIIVNDVTYTYTAFSNGSYAWINAETVYTPISNDEAVMNCLQKYVFNGLKWMRNGVEFIPAVGDIAVKDGYTGFTYLNDVPAQMTQKFNIRTTATREQLDVSVDWGDGHVDVLRNGDYIVEDSSFYTYVVSHTYETPGRYIVRIYGEQYFAIACPDKYNGVANDNSLVSRVLDADLPVSSHLTNFSSMCSNSMRLLRVDNQFSKNLFRVINTSSMFARCKNLIQCTGFGGYLSPAMYSCSWMFNDCWSLSNTDFVLPGYFTDEWGIKGVFANNKSLSVDINTLLPLQGFHVKNPNRASLFLACPLTGTVPANMFWDDKDTNWQAASNTFGSCPVIIRGQVPKSWGGAADNGIISKSMDEKYAELLERVEALESAN